MKRRYGLEKPEFDQQQ